MVTVGPVHVPGEPGIAIGQEEVVLTVTADTEGDASLGLRLAAVSAEKELPIARDALNLLARKAPVPEQPWPPSLRATLVRVLASGRPAIAAVEALDRRHLFDRYLSEWAWVRNKPQRNPYHRFTVDRHLLEACANAASLVHRVDRPDLLLVGTLLHDLGKGFPGDHTEAGMVVATEVADRMGFEPDDRDVLVSLVEHHLLLPDVATRRDLTDPATAERVAEAVGSRRTLDLLAAMVEADSLATGPSAWSPWKAGLVAELVERTRRAPGRRAPPATGASAHRRRPAHHGRRPRPGRPGAGHRGSNGHRGGARPRRASSPTSRPFLLFTASTCAPPTSPASTGWPSRSSRPSPSTGDGRQWPVFRTI